MSNYRTPPSYHIKPEGLCVAIDGQLHLIAMQPSQLIGLAQNALAAAQIALRDAATKTIQTDQK